MTNYNYIMPGTFSKKTTPILMSSGTLGSRIKASIGLRRIFCPNAGEITRELRNSADPSVIGPFAAVTKFGLAAKVPSADFYNLESTSTS